jgi:hypothetical protein
VTLGYDNPEKLVKAVLSRKEEVVKWMLYRWWVLEV